MKIRIEMDREELVVIYPLLGLVLEPFIHPVQSYQTVSLGTPRDKEPPADVLPPKRGVVGAGGEDRGQDELEACSNCLYWTHDVPSSGQCNNEESGFLVTTPKHWCPLYIQREV